MTAADPPSVGAAPPGQRPEVLVVDTSAAVAVILGEPEAAAIRQALARARERLMSTATAIELGVVLEARLDRAGGAAFERFLRDARITLVDLDREQVDRALSAWRRFGKGNHPARLNLGDLFTYALADEPGRAFLCVGGDFAATDLPTLPGRPAATDLPTLPGRPAAQAPVAPARASRRPRRRG